LDSQAEANVTAEQGRPWAKMLSQIPEVIVGTSSWFYFSFLVVLQAVFLMILAARFLRVRPFQSLLAVS
jgi:hypothetical protein